MRNEYREAFTEIYEIFKLMPQKLLSKIPKKFKEMIEEEKSPDYFPNIKEPLEQQKLKDETIIILGLIYRDFICSPEERKMLQEKDAKEMQRIQKTLEEESRQKYNSENIFKKKVEKAQKESYKEEKLDEKELALIEIKDKWYEKVLRFFHNILKSKENI